MKIEQARVDALVAYAFNNRTHGALQVDRIAQSIVEFGFNQPLVVDENNIVIVGHGRLEAAKKLKLETVPVVRLESLTEAQKKAYRILDNKLQNDSEWDLDNLRFELDALEELGFDVEPWGLGSLTDLFDEEEPEIVEDDFEGDLEQETYIKTGDLIELGEHRLLCGDSTKAEDVERLMAGATAGGIVTDPPYGIGIDGQKESICKNPKHNRKAHQFMGWDSKRPPASLFESLVEMSCPTAIFGGNYFADLLPASRGWIYWSKGQDGLSMSDGELAWTNATKPLRCVTVNRAALQGSVHPTQKPVEVITFAVNYIEAEEGPLYDPFLGSGTTLIAAEQLGRKCYGMEISPQYCQVIIDRYKAHCEKVGKAFVCKINGENIGAKT